MISMLKGLLKYFFALMFYWSGVYWLLIRFRYRRTRPWPLVLMYHRIIEPEDAVGLQPGMYVFRHVFEKQMEYLSKCFRIHSVSDFARSIDNHSGYRRDELIITIDDGWRDNFTNALPILKKYEVAATIYLTANFIGTNHLFWFQEISSILSDPSQDLGQLTKAIEDVLKRYPDSIKARELLNENIFQLLTERDRFIEILKRLDSPITLQIAGEISKLRRYNPIKNNEERQILNWDEARQMANAGIEFGSHGLTHRLLDSLDLDETYKELAESKAVIEEKLNRSICSFTYPNGNYNSDIEKLVEKAGYACAFIVGKNPESRNTPDRFAIDRTGVHNGVSTNPFGAYSRSMFAWHLYRNMW